MYRINSSPNGFARKIQRSVIYFGAALVLATTAQAVSASCTYTVDSEWPNGFTASITIKNDTGAPINNWSVNWQYNTNRVTNLWNANLSGSNPYAATNLGWNGTIPPGQTVEFGFQGVTNGGTVESPTVNGAACAGGTPSSSSSSVVSSAPSSSSVPPVSSSAPSSSSVASSSLDRRCALDFIVSSWGCFSFYALCSELLARPPSG